MKEGNLELGPETSLMTSPVRVSYTLTAKRCDVIVVPEAIDIAQTLHCPDPSIESQKPAGLWKEHMC